MGDCTDRVLLDPAAQNRACGHLSDSVTQAYRSLALPGSLVVITYVPVLVVAGCADHRLPRADRVLIVGLHLASSSLADRPSTSTAHDHASDGERHKDGVDGDDVAEQVLSRSTRENAYE